MKHFKFSLLALPVLLAGLALASCKGGGSSDPFGSSGGGSSGGSSASGTSFTVQSGGVTGYWHGITVVADIQAAVLAIPGPVNPLTGLSSIQIVAKNPTICLPTVPAPTPCPLNNYQTSGSYRLATCRPSPGPCPTVPSSWYTPKAGGSISFDMKLEIPAADLASVYVYFGNPGCAYSYRVSDAQNTAALAGFTRISIPMSSFTPPVGCSLHPDVSIFELSVSRVGIGTLSPAVVDIENVVFTN